MHATLLVAAPKAAHAALPYPLAAAITALIAAGVLVVVLKLIGKLLTPKKKTTGRSASSPYAATRK